MEKESQAVLKNLEFVSRKVVNGNNIVVGAISNVECVVLTCGIGKVNAAMGAQYLLDNYQVDCLVNFGVCGAKADRAEIEKIYLVDSVAQYDFDLTAINGGKVGQLNERDEVFFDLTHAKPYGDLAKLFSQVNLVTGDTFSESDSLVDYIEKNFAAALRDMEGCAVAQVCICNHVDCILVKGVSDYVGSASANLYSVTCPKILSKMSLETERLVRIISRSYRNVTL